MKVETKQIVNGVDVARLVETIDSVKSQPELAKFKFRVANRWMGGGENQSRVDGFYGCNEEMQRGRLFTLVADEPELLLGRDEGANPVEYLLHALAACVTTSMIYHAAAKGIRIEAVESSLEGDVDLRGFFGIDPGVRNGYQEIRMKLKIKADASDDEIQELGRLGPSFSPVFDSITRGVPVAVTAERI